MQQDSLTKLHKTTTFKETYSESYSVLIVLSPRNLDWLLLRRSLTESVMFESVQHWVHLGNGVPKNKHYCSSRWSLRTAGIYQYLPTMHLRSCLLPRILLKLVRPIVRALAVMKSHVQQCKWHVHASLTSPKSSKNPREFQWSNSPLFWCTFKSFRRVLLALLRSCCNSASCSLRSRRVFCTKGLWRGHEIEPKYLNDPKWTWKRFHEYMTYTTVCWRLLNLDAKKQSL